MTNGTIFSVTSQWWTRCSAVFGTTATRWRSTVRRCGNRKVEAGGQTENQMDSAEEYVRRVLDAYRQTPVTTGVVRRPDRLFAAQLHTRGVPISTVENPLVLAAARRLMRPADRMPLGIIRSLAYFAPVIEEVLESRVHPEYYRYLRHKIQRFLLSTQSN
jgi:hypothetical protein